MRRLSDLLVIITVVTIAATGGDLFIRRYVNDSAPSIPLRSLEPGSRVAIIPGHPWEKSSYTLVLGLRLGCPYCEASMPFYQRLIQLERSGKLRTHIIAVFPDPGERLFRILPDGLTGADVIAGVTLGNIGIRSTPTVMVIAADSTLLNVWRGQLSDDGEEEVLRAVMLDDSTKMQVVLPRGALPNRVK